MRSLSPKQALLTWIGGGLLCIAALAWLCFSFFAQRLQANADDLLEAHVTIEANRRQQQNLSNLSKQVAEIQEHAKELTKGFVDRTKALAFVEYIEEIAAKHNVEQTFTPVEPTRTVPTSLTQYVVEERPYQLTLKGKTPNLFHFLAELEANPIYVLTTSVALSREEGGNATMNLQGTIPWH